MSDIYLTRRIFTNKSTVGKLIFEDLELWTLEDTARMLKVASETCIPSGVYPIEIRNSKRYQRPMPYLLNVPFFDAIMIHMGNVPKDTRGCILVGNTHPAEDIIGESAIAFDRLFPRIVAAVKVKPIKLHIAGGYSKEEFERALKHPVQYA